MILTSSGITVSTSSNNIVFSTFERGLSIVARSTVPCCSIKAANYKKHQNI